MTRFKKAGVSQAKGAQRSSKSAQGSSCGRAEAYIRNSAALVRAKQARVNGIVKTESKNRGIFGISTSTG